MLGFQSKCKSFLFLCFVVWSVLLTGCFQTDRSVDKQEDQLLIQNARTFMANNEPLKAIKELEKCLQSNQNGVEIYELLAEACLKNNDPELSGFYYEQAANLSDLKYYDFVKAAESYILAKEWQKARECLTHYLEIFPEDQGIQVVFAELLYRLGENKLALPILLKYASNDVKRIKLIAKIFAESGNWVQAKVWLLKAFSLDNQNVEIANSLWESCAHLGDIEVLSHIKTKVDAQKIKNFDNIVSSIEVLESAEKELLRLKGTLNLESKLNFSGLDTIKSIFSNQEQKISSQQEPSVSGNVFSSEQRKRELESLVASLENQALWKEASDQLWKLLGIDNHNSEYWLRLANCLENMGRFDVEEMALWEALKRENYSEDIYLQFLAVAVRNHESTEYLRLLREAKKRLRQSAEIQLMWARAQEIHTHNLKKAKKAYRRFLNLAEETDPRVQEIRSLLEKM